METTSNMETTSTWEFDGICNTQERQAAADRKWQQEMEAELLANRERQQELREQAAGPWVVQDTAARLPSVSFRMLPMVYSSGFRFRR